MKLAVNILIKISYVFAFFTCSYSKIASAGEAASITAELDVAHPGAAISTNYVGLSFEVALLLPTENGRHYFSPDNQPLINLFHTLGIRSLRVGGNTSDRDAKQLPGPADWDSLFAFAKAARVKVIYCLQLYNGDPLVAAHTVKYIMDRYAPLIDCFSIGQEPSAYPNAVVDNRPSTERMGQSAEHFVYATYAKEWKRFAEAIIAVAPEVKFCGPGVHLNGRWACEFMAEFGRSNHVALITEHLYAGGAGDKVPTPEIGRSRMLSDEFVQTYQKLYDGFVAQSASNSLQYRLEEVNNYYNGGATNVSNTFASALWSLDFMYWWAEHGAVGINFHTGDRVAAGSIMLPSKYTAFFSTTNGYHVRPLGYGIKAFYLGSQGRMIPAKIINLEKLNASIYAVLGDDQYVYVTVINKESGACARSLKLAIKCNTGEFKDSHTMNLVAGGNDIATSRGQTLGGAEFSENGNWSGEWTTFDTSESSDVTTGILHTEIPAASGAIIRMTIFGSAMPVESNTKTH